MRITEAVEHAAAPDRVFEMLTSAGYQDLRCERSGASEHEVAVELEDDATTVVTRRRMSTEGFPDFARSLVGDSVDVIETQRWGPAEPDGSRTASLAVSISRTPVSLNGSVTLEPSGEGTRHVVEGDLEAHLPFVGGRIEQAVAPVISSAVRLEREVGQEWLAGHPQQS